MSEFFTITKNTTTKQWWTFLSVLIFVFVPFLILWILCGEFNLLGLDWLLPKNVSVWHGLVKNDNIEKLANQFYRYNLGGISALRDELTKHINDKNEWSIVNQITFFNWTILLPMGAIVIWSFIYPIIFRLFKLSNVDILPFSLSFSLGLSIFMLSGLMDQWPSNFQSLWWIVRILIAFVCLAIMFLIFNKFVNMYLINHKQSIDLYFDNIRLTKQSKIYKKELVEAIDYFKNNEDEITSVEIEQE